MAQRGRKKGCTDEEAVLLRHKLYEAYDELRQNEKSQDHIRAGFLPRTYYVQKLYEMHIASWSKSRIRRLLMYRCKYEQQ